MKIDSIHKQYLLYGMLLLTITATVYYQYEDTQNSHKDIVNVSARINDKYLSQPRSNQISPNQPIRLVNYGKVDIFESNKPIQEVVNVKPQVKIVSSDIPIITPPVIPAPTAPPIPFKYIGKIYGDNEYQVFIGFNNKNLIVKEGEVIQQTYKIEKISPPVMTFTYIPMSILQSMQIGEPN